LKHACETLSFELLSFIEDICVTDLFHVSDSVYLHVTVCWNGRRITQVMQMT